MKHANGISMQTIKGMVENKKCNEINNAVASIEDVEQIYKDILNASNNSYKGIKFTSRNNSDYVEMKSKEENKTYFFYDEEGNFYVRFLNQQHQIFFTRKYDAEGKIFELSDKLWETDPVEKIPEEEITKTIDERIAECKKEIEEMKEETNISKENKQGFEIED